MSGIGKISVVCLLILFLFSQINVRGLDGKYEVSTTDGLSISLDESGCIENLQIDNLELVKKVSPAFWIRDFTVDYDIENLVYNPDFEIDDDNDGVADGWRSYVLQGSGDIFLDEENIYSGDKSLKMSAYSSNKPSQMIYISSPINVKGDVEYRLSLFVMDDFGFLEEWWVLSVYVYCIFYNTQGEKISQEELQIQRTVYSWKQFSKIIISPEDAVEAELMLVFNGPKDMSVPGVERNSVWFDDIVFYEMPDETKMRPVTGALKQIDDYLVYDGSFEDLGFRVTYESRGEYIEINGEIKNSQQQERALDVYFLLPINASGWLWWDDIRNQREIEDGLYEMVVNADESSYLPLSVYPTSAITNKDIGLSIAIPLSKPRIFRIFYDTNLDKFGISFSLGLSPLTKFNVVNFTIYLYKCDPEWSFRSALDRYYRFFPEYFEKNLGSDFWFNASGDLADFGIRFVQGHFYDDNYAKYLSELNKKNIYTCEYTLPSEFEPQSLQSKMSPSPNYEEFLNLIDYYAENGSYLVRAKAIGAKNSTISDINGDTILAAILWGPGWAPDKWLGKFPLNTDPELPGLNIANIMMNICIIPAFENAERYGAILNGVELDNFMNRLKFIDMNSSRFKYTDYPLTYSPNNFKPGIPAMNPMIEYLHHLSEWLEENQPNARITGNCIDRGISSFGFPYLAALPFEMISTTRWNFNDIELNYRRSMGYHRFVMAFQCGEMWDEKGRIIMPYVEEYINESIFYGIYPIMKDDFFQQCKDYEKARPLYQKTIPIIDELQLAGWEPLTYAKTNDEKIFVERFGEGTTIYFTVRNNDSVTKDYTFLIEAEKLGLEKIHLLELLSDTTIPYEYENGNIIVHDTIKGKETKVFKISENPFLSIEIIKPKENWLYLFNKPIICVGETIIVGGITIETYVTSSEEILKVEFYIDNKLKSTDEKEPYKWTWNEPLFGRYKITVSAYDIDGSSTNDSIMVWRIG
ncbi:MAG: hypothetical protein DRN12_03635 [Thermoplasmata archaeon]|nr:MAG: hypothetical protein DRN12_03635 [Thermoplasmata archaeon]